MKALAADRTYVRAFCPGCGKHCYASKKAARRAAKRIYPGLHMSTYQCTGFYHISSAPERRKKNPSARMEERERKMYDESFIESALNEMYEDAEADGTAPVFLVDGKTWDEFGEET